MPLVRLRAVHPTSGEPAFMDIPATGTVHVRAIPGATGVHIALEQEGQVVLRAEVESNPEDTLRLDVAHAADGGLTVTCPGRDVFTLPLNALEPRVARIQGGSNALDIAFVVDATARLCRVDTGTNLWTLTTPLLSSPEEWGRHVHGLVHLWKTLAGGGVDVRVTAIAFGDDPLPGVSARDLTAGQYKLWPTERRTGGSPVLHAPFHPCSADSLAEMLGQIPPSPGADFVDALADAIQACISLNWREQARRLVVLTGDSPGYSLVHPPPSALQLDAHVREVDVDSAAQRLFDTWGAEVVTIYHDIPRESGYLEDPRIRDALTFARGQYARLASTPALAVKKSTLAPEALAEALLTPTFFGMGASLPTSADL